MKTKLFINLLFAVALLTGMAAIGLAQNDEDPVITELFRSADRSMDAGDYDAAIADYVKILARDPESKNAYNGRGNAYLEKGLYDKAMADFNKNIELDPEDFYAYYGRGTLYYRLGDYQRSIDDHTKELELQSDRSLGLIERGNAYLKLKKPDEAMKDLNRAAALSTPAAYLARGLAFLEKGETADALADLRYYIREVPDDQDVRQKLIKLGVSESELPQAILSAQKDIPAAAKTAFVGAIRDIGQLEYDRALIKLTKAINISPKFAAAFYYRGYVNEMLGSLIYAHKIIPDYTNAISIDPKFAKAYERRAYIYFQNANRPKRAADINRAIVLDPRSAQANFYRGYFTLEGARAMLDISKAITLDPNYVDALIERADRYEEAKQYEKALADYLAIIKINRNDSRAYKGRASVYCKQKKRDLAAADEKRVVELGGEIETVCTP